MDAAPTDGATRDGATRDGATRDGATTHSATVVDGVAVVGALSPSRAADFRTCPLMFRLRTIDRLPEGPSPAALRGTLVHKVLELIFDLPPVQRTVDQAQALVHVAWEQLLDADPEVAAMFAGRGPEVVEWLGGCRAGLRSYFALEDPRRLEPAARELYVEALLDSRLLLRGIVDRVDQAADGRVRMVDYKTGRSPGADFESKALFQMRFYALMWWRSRGIVPTLLQLIYLADQQVLTYAPDEDDLRATERLVEAVWAAIARARDTGDFEPRRSSTCSWCRFKPRCPEFGGAPPPWPPGAAETSQPTVTTAASS